MKICDLCGKKQEKDLWQTRDEMQGFGIKEVCEECNREIGRGVEAIREVLRTEIRKQTKRYFRAFVKARKAEKRRRAAEGGE